MHSSEIVLPITSPETEWVRGRARPKMSPTGRHALVQAQLAVALVAWAKGRGLVGTEWRFRVRPEGEVRRPLVPDVAFVSRDLLQGRTMDELDAPPFAPTVAFEVLSPGDAAADVLDTVDVYLRAGSRLVVVADPSDRTIVLYDADGTHILGANDELRHPALPDFRLRADELFAAALDLDDFGGRRPR